MKKLLSILLILMMVFCFAACGGDEPAADESGQDSQQQEQQGADAPDPGEEEPDGSAGNISISTASIDGYDLPEAALAYAGTFSKAYNDLYNEGEITFYVKSTNADDDAFDALVDYYAASGGTLDEGASTSTTKCFDFSWGRIEAAHFGADEEISAYIILPEYPVAADGGGEDNSATAEPDSTGSSAGSSDGGTVTVESFLATYGFSTDDLTPNHFTSFEEIQMVGSGAPGERDSKGIVKINVEKGKTTEDDYNAWFENLYVKMIALSDDGKLWYTGGKAMEAPALEELKAEAWWTKMPGSTCYITVNENGKSTRINLDYSYDLEAEQYKVVILVHSVS